MTYHICALLMGFVIDLIVGDPYWMVHPIRWIGSFIAFLDRKMLGDIGKSRNSKQEYRRGILMTVIVVVVTATLSIGLLMLAYYLNCYFGVLVEAIMTAYVLACKSLRVESMKVYSALMADDLEGARYAVSMIVGRDTDSLDEAGITRAAVETVAENTSDGVIAPLVYTAIGGPALGMIYKAVNTMDSMVGYHNNRYEYFGKCAARLDDIANFIPARMAAGFMLAAALLLGKEYSARDGYRIFKRDRFNHKSPNSAQTESVCAGVLGLRLAGDAYYFGQLVKKDYIGDEVRTIEATDIVRSNRLMYATAFVAILVMTTLVYGAGVLI